MCLQVGALESPWGERWKLCYKLAYDDGIIILDNNEVAVDLTSAEDVEMGRGVEGRQPYSSHSMECLCP